MPLNDRYFKELAEYCEIIVPGRDMRRVPKARIDDLEAPQGRRWGDMIALAKELDRLRELLWQAEELASVALDWNLDEVEIDGAIVPTRVLMNRFQKDMLQPTIQIVPDVPQPAAVEETPSGPPQKVGIPTVVLYTGTGHSQASGLDREDDEYEDKEYRGPWT